MSQTHREAFPDQYQHELVGKRVTCPDGREGIVLRVVNTRFGQLVVLADDETLAYQADAVTVLQ